MAKEKYTTEVARQRFADVKKLYLGGKNREEISKYVHKAYGRSKYTVDQDLRQIRKDIVKQYERHGQNVITDHLAKYNHIYSIYMDEESDQYNPQKAASMLEKIEKLLNLRHDTNIVNYIDRNVNNTQVNNNMLGKKTTEELRSLLDKLDDKNTTSSNNNTSTDDDLDFDYNNPIE